MVTSEDRHTSYVGISNESGRRIGGPPRDRMRRMTTRFSLLGIGLIAMSCAQQAQHSNNPNRYIYVTTQSLDEQCYHDLGPVSVTEPYAQANMESADTTLANRLRTSALKQYPQDADAVINVHANDNEAGTDVTVEGEAVEVVDHTTVVCAIREAPPAVDTAADAAAGGMMGTLVAGLISESPQGAEGGGWLGAAAAGSYSAMTKRQKALDKDQDLHDALAQQKQQITALQDERARLNECKEEEIPLGQCTSDASSATAKPVADTSDEPDWNASQFDLEKQIQMQQDYIGKLQDQIGDIKTQMRHGQQPTQ
jgi:hypothetical protein